MEGAEPWEARVLAGTLLSSLGRYRLFMTSSAWGMWHFQVYEHELLDLPVRLRREHPATERVVAAVDRLLELPSEPPVAHFASLSHDPSVLRDTLNELNAAVFDLFELGDDERDLVADFWTRFTEPQAPLPSSDSSARHGVAPPESNDHVSRYVRTFLQQWNDLLRSRAAHLEWEVVRDPNISVTAAVFRLIGVEDEASNERGSSPRWRASLERFAAASDIDRHGGGRLYREGLLRAVSDDGIVIAKRDEARLWTRSAAREDAEATMLQAIRLEAR